MTGPDFAQLTERLAVRLMSARARLVTAESCTGGWLAKTLTDLPGSSRWFECGYVTYSNAAKMRDLGVGEQTLALHGAVSEATALEMATGALRCADVEVAISVTGVAGPDGGTAAKPVGTVWFAVATKDEREAEARVQHFQGDRDAIRIQSVRYALEWLVAIQVLPNSTTV